MINDRNNRFHKFWRLTFSNIAQWETCYDILDIGNTLGVHIVTAEEEYVWWDT